MVIQEDSAWHLYLQYKAISRLFSGRLFKAVMTLWGDLERKGLEIASKGNCQKTHAKPVFCPVETKWFVMFCTFTRFQNRLSLQWDYLNPTVTELGSVLRTR